MKTGNQRIEWLAIMRGLNILLVVIAHAQLINITTGDPFPITDYFSSYLVPVRMPLFIFCSGGLLYLSRIQKNWTVGNLYRDKAQRILCPFLFFVTFYYVLKMAMNVYVKTKVDYSVADFFLSFAVYSNHPSVHLWFLAVLMWFMLLYPLFQWLCQKDMRMILFLAFSIGIYFIDTQPDPQKNYFFLLTLNHYLVYFFAGIFFFRFRLYEYLNYWWTTLLLVALYVLFYTLGLWLLTSMTGILAAVSLCRQLSRFLPGLFSSFREYIYQIYLISLIFQGLVELILWRKLFYSPQMVVPFFVLNILLGLYVPVLISKLVERTSYRWLHLALGLKKAKSQEPIANSQQPTAPEQGRVGATVRKFVLLLFCIISLPLQADSYDPDNYKPEIDTTKIEKTNLPIVFIDTRCGGEETQAIHKDWRIAARMKIISNADGTNYGDTIAHPDQTVDYEGWIAIRYRGNTSFNNSLKKPYNFKTMKTADPDGDKLKTELLGMPKDNTWVLLAPYGDRSLLRDVLVWQLARPYFDYTPRCRYCELVLDGIYYGIFVLAENIRKGKYRLNLDDPGLSGDELTGGYQLQIDRNDEPCFISKYKAVDSNGNAYSAYYQIYLQYKHPDYEEMDPVQIEYIQQRVEQMEDALASDDFTNPDTGYRQYLDPMSFIDQQLSQEISGNVDGYRLSTNIYKHRDSQDPRFKTALWDFNLAFANSNATNAKDTDFWRYQNTYLTNYNAFNKVPFWWMRLMEDPAYVTLLKERYAQYRNENYTIKHIEATIDSITTLLSTDGALERNNTTWKMFKSSTYDMQIDQIKQWIRSRIEWMDLQLDYDPSGIIMPSADFNKRIVGYYTLKGERIKTPSHNTIVIVRYSDGTARKIKM